MNVTPISSGFKKTPCAYVKFRQTQSQVFTWHNESKHSGKRTDAFTQCDINQYRVFSMENRLSQEIW